MTSEEKQLQLKKIDQLEKILVRLEWIIILMTIFTCVLVATLAMTRCEH